MSLAITIRTYTDDGWYGKQIRYCYLGHDGNGLKNKTEALKLKSVFKKFIKNRIKIDSHTQINGDIEIGKLSDFETYRYCGAGPSFSCPLIFIDHSELISYINV